MKSRNILEEDVPNFIQRINTLNVLIQECDTAVENLPVAYIPDNDYALPEEDYMDMESGDKPKRNHFFYQKIYNSNYLPFTMLPVQFLATMNQVVLIKFKMNIKLPASDLGHQVKVFINANVVKTYNIPASIEMFDYCVEYNECYYNTNRSNIIFIEVKRNVVGGYGYEDVFIYNLEMDLWGVNAHILHFEKKYNVTCFNNTYYITKCINNKCYLMEKSVLSFEDINEDDFVEIPGAFGLSAQITFSSKQESGEYVFDKKILTTVGPNGELKILNLTDNSTVAFITGNYGFRVAECLPHKNASEYVLEFVGVKAPPILLDSQKLQYRFTSALNSLTATTIPQSAYIAWFLPILSPTGNINDYVYPRYIYGGLPQFGVSLCDLDYAITSLCGVMNSTYATGYYVDNNPNKIEIYSNALGKCVRAVVEKPSGAAEWSVSERKIIGKYDYYYKGANNDYFYVVNGDLYYYKKST